MTIGRSPIVLYHQIRVKVMDANKLNAIQARISALQVKPAGTSILAEQAAAWWEIVILLDRIAEALEHNR